MLPKRNRLSKREILALLPHAKVLRGDFLFLKFKKLEKEKTFKAGVSISKKVLKKAVDRNRTRRIIYRELSLNKKNIAPSLLFFVVNKNFQKEDIKKEIEHLLVGAKVI